MKKYIEIDKLIDEIEKWISKAKEKYNESTYSMGRCDALAEFRNHIASLQQEQPEEDLEKITNVAKIKELPNGFEKEWLTFYHTDKEYNSARFFHLSLVEREYIIARYFYERGKNARKEE